MDAQKDKISVVLVDDSAVIRGALSRILESDPAIAIVGSVSNGEMGITIAGDKKPDVVILDVEMPVMDGLTALPRILKASPKTKIIMCSTLTEKGANVTLKAMSLGAVESIVKPTSAQDTGPGSPFRQNILSLVKSLAPRDTSPATSQSVSSSRTSSASVAPAPINYFSSKTKEFSLNPNKMAYTGKPAILAIGSSTGGPNALFEVIKGLKNVDIPIVITQHMPATFTKILAQHIHDHTGIPSHEGAEGMRVQNGNVYVAPGGKHMVFTRDSAGLVINLDDGPPENFCKPSVDPMLRSLIEIYGSRVLCTILTGMGHDGLGGARILVEKGGRVIAQDEKTSVVWGMPGAVAMNGLCSAVLPLTEISTWLTRAVAGK